MQFTVETTNFKASGEITSNGVQYSVRPRTQAARMVCKLRQLKRDGLNGSASLDVVADTLRQYEAYAATIANIKV